MTIRHFLLTNEGSIEEFSEEEASRVAVGDTSLPRFADKRLRYLQVAVEAGAAGRIQVRTLGAVIGFDAEGRLREAGAPDGEEGILSHFEHDACVQFALKDTVPGRYALN
jgi:hypothetical protein